MTVRFAFQRIDLIGKPSSFFAQCTFKIWYKFLQWTALKIDQRYFDREIFIRQFSNQYTRLQRNALLRPCRLTSIGLNMWHHVYWLIRPDLNQLPIPNSQSFLDHWQTLLASALGAVLTVVGSVYASKRDARIKELATELTARKEAFRKIEISCVMSLEDVIMCIEQLHMIHGLIQKTVEEVKRTSSTVFAIHETNIPLTRNLYRDPELAMLKTKSSYLHNKLIIINRLLKGANDTIDDLRQDYSDLLKRNRFIIELESRKSQPVPAHQQEAYMQGLVAFSESLIIYAEREFPHILRVIEQVIVYERLLAQDFEKTKEEYEPEEKKSPETDAIDQHPLDLVDKIDERIQSDVEKIHEQIKTRLETNRAERGKYVV